MNPPMRTDMANLQSLSLRLTILTGMQPLATGADAVALAAELDEMRREIAEARAALVVEVGEP